MIAVPTADIAPGDRAPNFVLPGADGRHYMLYERVHGGDVLLLLASDATALAPFRTAAADFAEAGVEPFAVIPGDAPTTPPPPDDPGFFIVYDVKRAIGPAYSRGAGVPFPGPGSVLCLLCDANLRVIAIMAGPGSDMVPRCLDVYKARPRRGGTVLSGIAPVLLIPDVLDAPIRQDLIALWDRGGHEEGKVYSETTSAEGDRLYRDKKSRLDHTIQDPDILKPLYRIVGRRIAPELEKAYQFQGFVFDRMIVGCYDSARGDRFAVHRDNLGDMKRRTFALTINLNADYDGGEIRFPEYGPDWYKAPSGCAVLFSCSLLHEVRPLVRGRRFALLTFLLTPEPAVQGKPGAKPRPNIAAAMVASKAPRKSTMAGRLANPLRR